MKIRFLLAVLAVLAPAAAWAGGYDVSVFSGFSFPGVEGDRGTPWAYDVPSNAVYPVPVFWRNHFSLEESPLFGARCGRFLNRRMALEGSFMVAPSHEVRWDNVYDCPPGQPCPLAPGRNGESGPNGANVGTDLMPFYMSRENASAYHYDVNFVYHVADKNVRPYGSFGVGAVTVGMVDRNETDFAFNVGLGAKFFFKHMGVRFEVNDHIIPDHFLSGETEHDVQVLYGFVFTPGQAERHPRRE